MSDKMRWRYGDTNPVVAGVDADTVIEIGDIVYQADDTTLPLAVAMVAVAAAVEDSLPLPEFLGVAMQRSRKGETLPIRVATTGVFEFDINDPKRPQELGQFIGPAPFQNQIVSFVDAKVAALGRIAKRNPTGAFSVLVDIRSVVMTGGVL
jgi:hypothetical protein